MQHLVQRLARCRPERVAGVVGGRDEGAVPDVGRHPQEFGDLLFVLQVQRCPGRSQSASASRQHVAPCRREQRSPQAGLVASSQAWRMDARNDQHGHLTHVLAEIGDAVPHSSLYCAALRIVGEQRRGRSLMT